MTNRPRLLHVFSTFGAGGAQLLMAGVMNELGPAWSHSVMAMDGNFEAAYKLDPARVELVKPPPLNGSLGNILALRRLLDTRRPSLLLTYNWGAIEAVAGGIVSRACPVIHQEHGFGAEEADGLKQRRVMARRILLNRILGTVVPSKTLQEIALEQYRVTPGKVLLIRNGVDVERFQPRPRDTETRRRLGVADNTVLFGYVGRLGREKNLGLLIRAFARSGARNAALALVGDGECVGELREVAREAGIAERVIFTGAVQDPAPHYAALDVFAMSSLTEQTPMALLEAMACGLPAVATDVGDTSDLLGGTGFPAVASKGDLKGYAGALRELGGRPELRAALGEANRRRCVEQFSLRRMVEQYAAVWEGAVRPQGPLFVRGTN